MNPVVHFEIPVTAPDIAVAEFQDSEGNRIALHAQINKEKT